MSRRVEGRYAAGRIVWMIVVTVILFIMNGFENSSVSAAVSSDTTVDFVLVLDCSGSMNESDQERLSVSAAKMFVDMLPAENARLAVIAFGDSYGSEAYVIDTNAEDSTNYSRDRIKLAFPLGNITGQKSKQEAKEVIDQITIPTGKENYTPIGFALEAANEILETGNSAEDSAGIILLSDGRVSGQGVNDSYNGGYDFHSIDAALEEAAGMGWPIYSLELNYDKMNRTDGNSSGKVGCYQMREHIPVKTNAAHIELTNPTEAQDAFAEIFAKFFDAQPTTASGIINDGQVSLDFEIGEMIAETNLTLTGDISSVSQVVVRNSDGKETVYTKSVEEENRIVTFGDKYITMKLMTPKEGEWSVTAYGTDGVEIGLYAVSIREMNLQLHASAEGGEEILPKGSVVNFTASYIYNGTTYSSDSFYKNTTAYLVVEETGEKVQMTGGQDNYSASYTFGDSGSYTAKACVESDLFRNDTKESGSYVFQVGNLPTEAKGEIPSQEISVGESVRLDCSQYFTNPDNDSLNFNVNADKSADFTWSVTEDGVLDIQTGKTAGTYLFTIGANDGGMETDALQTMELHIVNQPMTMAKGVKDGGKITVDFAYNAPGFPEALLKLAGLEKENERDLVWEDYFSDPDGIPVDVSVSAETEEDSIVMTSDGEKMHFTGTGKGHAVYQVTARDGSDSSVSAALTVQVNSLDAKELVWKKIRIPLFIMMGILAMGVIILMVIFGNRKIYGIWDVSGSGYYENDRKLGVTRSGKRSRCKLDSLLDDLNIPNGFGGVELAAGNNLSKKVLLKNLGKLDAIVYNGSELSDTSRVKKLAIGKGQSVTLEKDGVSVTLERH